MADLKTTFMGIQLKNPLIVGACSLSKKVDTIKRLEDAGVGAVVIKSLFEEQVQLERHKYVQEISRYDGQFAEALSFFPKLDHAGPSEHLAWVKEVRKSTRIPLIASLNATSRDIWVEYATLLAETGVDGLELNFYSLPLDPTVKAADVENDELETLARIRQAVRIPISVKMRATYTSMLNVAHAFAEKADALVLFNRFFEPDIDTERETETARLVLSESQDSLNTLRWIAILHGRVKADLGAGTGILTADDAVKMILAGASAVQLVTAVYKHGTSVISTMLTAIEAWMSQKGYKTIGDFKGKLGKKNVKDPWGYERGQYIKLLLGFD